MAVDKDKLGKGRIAYPDHMFVSVPIEAIDSGFLRELNAAELRRWLALLRVANQRCKIVGEKFQVTEEELRKFDRASQRTAYRATRGLQARGVIWVNFDTKPLTYLLNWPTEWRDRKNHPLAREKQCLAPAWPKS